MEEKKLTIGLPRALLYYRYSTLWKEFFAALNVQTVVSSPTSKKTVDEGTALAIDETCLSAKIFMGHVKELIGKCDYILVPRVSSYGRKREFCTKFHALYDVTVNTFRRYPQKFISYNVDYYAKIDEQSAFIQLGQELGFSIKDSKKAYDRAKKAESKKRKNDVRKAEAAYKSEKIKVLIAAHSYVIMDSYLGSTVVDFLRRNDVEPIRADLVDRDEALRAGSEISPTCKWQVNREILGCIDLHKERIDGIILLSAFPCGPDSMVNEMIVRKIKGIPVLNMVLDGQSGTAGVETRLESFIDIIRFKEGRL